MSKIIVVTLKYPVKVEDDDYKLQLNPNDLDRWNEWFFQTDIDYTNLDIAKVEIEQEAKEEKKTT